MTAPTQPEPVVTLNPPPTPPAPPAQPPAGPPAGAVVMTPEEISRMQEETAARVRESFQSDLRTRDEQLAALTADLTTRQNAEAELEQQRAAEEERVRRENQTALEQINELRAQQERDRQAHAEELARRDAILAQERRLADLTAVRSQMIQQAGDELMPHLHQYVVGNTPEELAASIENLKQTSAQILSEAQEAIAQQQAQTVQTWRAAPGVGVTQPASGPVEQMGNQVSFTQEELAAMSPAVYARYRDQLLPMAGGNPAASGQMSGQGQGLFN